MSANPNTPSQSKIQNPKSRIDPYPLTFAPFLLSKVWGGNRLSRFGKQVSPADKIGESWELADLPSTSTGGAGGGAFRSVIANGPLQGKTLHDAATLWHRNLMGEASLTASGDFPLLIKLLDARENLSVQVHPSPQYAAAHPGANLKTECWYILEAAPGAVIYKGVKPGVTRDSFAAHIANGTVVNDLIAVPAVAGDCHTLPSGTVHALGAGVLVAEVQTPSDTTFRVFDWGRTGRQLHIQESLACIDWKAPPRPTRLDDADRWTTLAHNEFFRVDEVRLPDAMPHLFAMGGLRSQAGPLVLLVLDGAVTIGPEWGTPIQVGVGGTVLIPAAVVGWEPRVREGTRALGVALG
jgi:mannose-6-phosphate isomerase